MQPKPKPKPYTADWAVAAAQSLIMPPGVVEIAVPGFRLLLAPPAHIEDMDDEADEDKKTDEDKKAHEDKKAEEDKKALEYEKQCRYLFDAIAVELRQVVGNLPLQLHFVPNGGGASGKFWSKHFEEHLVYVGNLEDNEIAGYTDFLARILTVGEGAVEPAAAHALIGGLRVLARIRDTNDGNEGPSRLIAVQHGETNIFHCKVDNALKVKKHDAQEFLQYFFAVKMGVPVVQQTELLQRYGDFEFLCNDAQESYFIDFGAFRRGYKIVVSEVAPDAVQQPQQVGAGLPDN